MVVFSASSAFLSALLLASTAQARPHTGSEDVGESPKVLRVPINSRKSVESPGLIKRQLQGDLNGANRIHELEIDLIIGSDNQKVTLAVDSCADFTWVNPQCDNLLGEKDKRFKSICVQSGQYAMKGSCKPQGKSEAYRFGSPPVDPIAIDYVKDDMQIAGTVQVKDQTFGVATKTENHHIGLLGLGIPSKEEHKEMSILESLVKQDKIVSRSFSLDVAHQETRSAGDTNRNKGSVVFGGFHTGSYAGLLHQRDLRVRDGLPYYETQFDSLHLEVGDIRNPVAWSRVVRLDTGSPLMVFPRDFMQAIATPLQGELGPGNRLYTQCHWAQLGGELTFWFGGAEIKIKLSDLIETGAEDKDGYCPWRIQLTDGPDVYLGMPFFESAYVVFNQDRREVHLAQAAKCDGGKLVAIDANGVPSDMQGCPETGSAE